ncbi:fumarylacetoacetate hydrolase family protein [Streptacidiphilus fuscans]|uniref:Fumarylacetoacetate hydrolase family protein n=1 Tax=Streptacidiphilus fuscans TaxID=2789292 RepID=A0A931AZ65_9ACTN|nr:fumarylacetoacetate hydrolase family protein [Streptacidiphilus fuscans]MBF9067524.1 fumarylacetoacetate hydrolase family protein [Streptacidiphilus fuscans]
MRFLRIGPTGAERPALLAADAESAFDLSALTPDIDAAFLAALTPERRAEIAARADAGEFPAIEGRVGAPVARPGKVVCIGLNYRDHAEEAGQPIPAEPVVFLKSSDCVVGPDDEVLVPRGSEKTDYEIELAVVIGATARYLASPEDADAAIAGYTITNDVTERAWQLERGGTWDKGKSCDTFNPMGPWLVTADEVPDPQALGLRLSVNGEVRQNGSTANMIFNVRHVIWYLSQFMTLHPGDVVNTGTPAGVAMGLPNQPWLSVGDVVELQIDGLGSQRQVLGKA